MEVRYDSCMSSSDCICLLVWQPLLKILAFPEEIWWFRMDTIGPFVLEKFSFAAHRRRLIKRDYIFQFRFVVLFAQPDISTTRVETQVKTIHREFDIYCGKRERNVGTLIG